MEGRGTATGLALHVGKLGSNLGAVPGFQVGVVLLRDVPRIQPADVPSIEVSEEITFHLVRNGVVRDGDGVARGANRFGDGLTWGLGDPAPFRFCRLDWGFTLFQQSD